MESSSLKLSVVIPVYLGDSSIELLCDKLVQILPVIESDYEIILVNDASPDHSWQKIKSLCQNNKRIKGINLSRNFGQHPAISAGLKYAFGEKIIIMDCDFQDSPEDLPELWEKSQEGFDIVMARRIQRKESICRRFISWSFHQILSLKTGKKIDPAIANYAIYDRKVIEEYYAQHNNRAFSVLNLKQNYSFATVDVQQRISERGKSGYTLSKLFSLAFTLLFPGKINFSKTIYVIQKTINIVLEDYGVRLIPLTAEKIEMLRQWRNDPDISRYMIFREYITPEMQEKWFEERCNQDNYYFIIHYEGKDVGLCDIKNIRYEEKTAEGGIFIYEKLYLNSDIAIRASLCALDFGDKVLDLTSGTARILRSNKRAIEYNKMLGYMLLPGQENEENQLYALMQENYYKQRKYLINLLE